ncbi:MAG: methyl-accepting chemotaxis protein [Desulfobulbaceae bacterium]|nr:methyl-accepting chemotaxis protein [Desulfobulbaceae bacterium]
MNPDKNKRKKLNLNVKREFQKWLLLRMTAQVLLSSLVAAVILYFYARNEITDSFYSAHVTIRRVSDLLLPVIAAGSAVSFLGTLIVVIFLPQRIAGPLYRIEKRLAELKEGDLRSEIKLRRNDILQDMAATLNDCTGSLREKIKLAQENQAQLEKTFRKAAEAGDAFGKLKENLDSFKT